MTLSVMLPQASDQTTNTPQGAKDTPTGPYKIGGDVSPPKLIHSVVPKFPEAARRLRLRAKVLINLDVDIDGKPINVHTVRTTFFDSNGHIASEPNNHEIRQQLEETAIDATKQYRFKPAMKGGKPVLVELNVEIPYQIY
jgi:periplasmic protein TonB